MLHTENLWMNIIITHSKFAGRGSLVGCASDWYSGGRWFDPPVRQHSFMEIGNEIITTILSLMRIQVGQLSVTVERIRRD